MMVATGEQAVGTRQFDRAEEIGLAIKNADPDNADAQVLLNAARKGQDRMRTVAFQQPSLLDRKEFQGEPINNQVPPVNPGEGLIPTVQQEIRIKTERLTLEVNRSIQEAKSRSLTSPEEAIDIIKLQLAAVDAATDIAPEARAQLLRRLRTEQLDLYNRQRMVEANLQHLAEREAALRRTGSGHRRYPPFDSGQRGPGRRPDRTAARNRGPLPGAQDADRRSENRNNLNRG
jgi:hypothetical protein